VNGDRRIEVKANKSITQVSEKKKKLNKKSKGHGSSGRVLVEA
jgi:hypothetical protein